MILFQEKEDALEAYEHLKGDDSKRRTVVKQEEESKVGGSNSFTEIDGKRIHLRFYSYEYSYRSYRDANNRQRKGRDF